MSIYRDRVVPYLIHLSMKNRALAPYRTRVIGAAEGRVLEIGIGSGHNLPFYTPSVEFVLGLDPARPLLRMAENRARDFPFPIEVIGGSAEAIPLESSSFDTVVTTWTLCTVPDVDRALGEMRRVLKPGGSLLFVEHGHSPDRSVERWQNRLNPFWRRFSGGCNLNRKIDRLIAAASFRVDRIETGYMKGGPRPMTFMYEGMAVPR